MQDDGAMEWIEAHLRPRDRAALGMTCKYQRARQARPAALGRRLERLEMRRALARLRAPVPRRRRNSWAGAHRSRHRRDSTAVLVFQ